MKKLILTAFLSSCSFLLFGYTKIDTPNTQFSYIPKPMGKNGSFFFLGEIGETTLRANSTYGLYLSSRQRCKISLELLSQPFQIFSPYVEERWLHHFASGGVYEYRVSKNYIENFKTGFSYAYALKKHLTPLEHFRHSMGLQTYLGPTFCFFKSNELTALLYYDRLYYSQKAIQGAGLSVHSAQRLPKNFSINLLAELRTPHSLFETSLSWNHYFGHALFNVGFYVNYCERKNDKDATFQTGINCQFAFGDSKAKKRNFISVPLPSSPSFSAPSSSQKIPTQWVSSPAVYLPQVITSPFQNVARKINPQFSPHSDPIQDQVYYVGESIFYPLGSFFYSEKPLKFSSDSLPEGLFLETNSGILTGCIYQEGVYDLIITASSEEGVVNRPLRLIIDTI